MKNTYIVYLTNHQGCCFDNAEFTNLKEARAWAAGRGMTFSFGKWHKYRVDIEKNGDEFMSYYTR